MSIRIMSQVWERAPYKGSALLVLLALADHANDQGVCWPSIPTLAARARCSERYVMNALSDAEKDGWLEVTRRPGLHNNYRVAVPEQAEKLSTTPEPQFTGEAEGTGEAQFTGTPEPQFTPPVNHGSPEPPRTIIQSSSSSRGADEEEEEDLYRALTDEQRRAFSEHIGEAKQGRLVGYLRNKGELNDRVRDFLSQRQDRYANWPRAPRSLWEELSPCRTCGHQAPDHEDDCSAPKYCIFCGKIAKRDGHTKSCSTRVHAPGVANNSPPLYCTVCGHAVPDHTPTCATANPFTTPSSGGRRPLDRQAEVLRRELAAARAHDANRSTAQDAPKEIEQ